ncbi:MAG: flagellar hook-associated protein FlgK [Oxalobacter sp.]|nr:MAG: flagellar hook-associated protein FlgK [Oxalobacter sp.]
MTNILSIGKSALISAQVGIDVTGQNIANASTVGYSRQIIVQGALPGQNMGYGFVGKGTEVLEVRRIYSDYLGSHLRTSQSSFSSLDSYYSQIQQIDSLLADNTVGLSPSLQSFFSSLQDVATNPSSTVMRQSLLSSAESLASTFQSIDEQLGEINQGLNSQITASITKINSYATQISDLNKAIEKVMGSVQDSVPNDLFDQRDQLLAELSKEISVSVVQQGNSYDVYIGNGQPIVVGGSNFNLVGIVSPTDPLRTEVAYQNQDGSTSVMSATAVSGGSLAGLLEFRSETLDVARNSVGRIATVLASTFNEQHRLGQDLNGDMGRSFSGITATANNTTTAALSVAISNADLLTTSGYQITYDGTNYTLTRLSDSAVLSNTTLAAAQAASLLEGFSLAETAPMLSGDSFTIMPTPGSDFFNVAAPLVTPSRFNTSTATVAGTIVDAKLLTTSDYNLSFDGTDYTLTRISDNTKWTSPTLTALQTAAAGDGFGFTVSGTMNAGDNFSIRPTANGASGLSVAITNPAKVTTAAPMLGSAGSSNTGSGVITAGTVNNPMLVSEATLRSTVTITFNTDGTYNVAGTGAGLPATNVAYTEGADISYNGWTVKITGVPAAGDTFTIASNAAGQGDNRNALLLAALQTTNLVANSTATYQTAYSQLVNMIGNKTSEVKAISASAETIYTNAYNAVQQESGVNLDEEAANLLRYQQAYQAAAKVMQIASELFDALLAIRS